MHINCCIKETESNPEEISNIKSIINKYNWKGINYPSKIDDLKTFEKNNPTVALNTLYTKEKQICLGYISKTNSICEKQIILLTSPNEKKEGWHYLAVRKLTTLLKGTTSTHHSGICCLNCLRSHEKVCGHFLWNCDVIRKE